MPIFNLQLEFDENGAIRAARRLDDVGDAASRAGREGRRACDDMSKALSSAAKKVMGLVSAYLALDKAMGFIKRGIEFNDSLEQSRIGIASLITSMVKLEDAQGRALEGAEKYAAAQGVAKEVMAEIQRLGLETTATSQELVEGVQSIMGPALQAGMALKDIPQFAVAGAQAMQTLGVPLNQMRTELEALLSGSVNKSQDVLAPKLFADIKGDLNEYLKGLKESGTLIDEIMKRLEPFKLAGKDVENTWSALVSNLEEAVDLFAGEMTKPLLDKLKQAVDETKNLVMSSKEGATGIGGNFQEVERVLKSIMDIMGDGILAATRKVIDAAKDFNLYLGSSEAEADLNRLITTLKLVSAALIGVSAAKAFAFGKNFVSGAITRAKTEMDNYRNSLVTAATAERDRAQAALNAHRAWMASAEGRRAMLSSVAATNAAFAKETALLNQVTAAQTRLNQVQTIGNMRAAMGALGNGLKSLMNMMGGPFGVALMAATTGYSLLAMKTDDAAEATDRHAAAQKTYSTVAQGVIDINGKLVRSLTEIESVEARAEKRQLTKNKIDEVSRYAKSIEEIENELDNALFKERYDNGGEESALTREIKDATDKARDFFNAYRHGSASLDETKQKLEAIFNALPDKNIKLGEWINSFFGNAKLKELEKGLADLNTALEGSEKANKAAASGTADYEKSIKDMADQLDKANKKQKAEVDTLAGALEWFTKRNANTKEGKKLAEDLAKATDLAALATLQAAAATAEFNAQAANTAIAKGNVTEAMIQLRDDAIQIRDTLLATTASMKEAINSKDYSKPGGYGGPAAKSGRSGASKSAGVDPKKAAEDWAKLEDQLAQLKNESTGAGESLKSTLKSIDETGKAAKKSAGEIEAMKQAFIDLSDDKILRELDKELYQVMGKTRELQRLDNEDKVNGYRARLGDLQKMGATEKEILLGRYQAEVLAATARENEQKRLNFYKETADLAGDYIQSIEYQNRLIELQAQEWERDGIPIDAINERVRLLKEQLARDPFSGLMRGMKSYADEASNLADQMQSAVGDAFQGMEDAFVNFVQTGKMSFTDLANSIISDLMRIAVRAAITGPLAQGLGSLFGSLFGGGISASAYSGTANNFSSDSSFVGPMIPGTAPKFASGGAFSGGSLSAYSNSIVASPTIFGYSRALAPYARGAGLMGEAGPEAIMPLSRASNGDLGVKIIQDYPKRGPSDEFLALMNTMQTEMRKSRQETYGANAAPNFSVNITNNSAAQVQAGQPRPDGQGGFSMDVIVAQVEQAMVGRAKQGKSQLMQYQEKAYGMNRAAPIARGKGRA